MMTFLLGSELVRQRWTKLNLRNWETSVYEWPMVLDQNFDIVFTSSCRNYSAKVVFPRHCEERSSLP
jgi:hypothetical protein